MYGAGESELSRLCWQRPYDRSVTSAANIAFATCDKLAGQELDEDRLLYEAARRAGLSPRTVSWSDPTVDWDEFDLTLIRSTWDYTLRRSEFLDWLHRVPRLHNPASVVAPNTDKGYLAELSQAGIPIVPTVFAAPNEPLALPTAGEYVLKPTVGAGSRGAGRFDADRDGEQERARAHTAQLHRLGRTVMLQPYLDQIDQLGETALIFIDGEFSHAARKGRMLAEGTGYAADGDALFLEEQLSAATPTEPELRLAEQVLAELSRSVADALLYARIDLLPSARGPLLGEAELTEPSLFLPFAPAGAAAADRLVAAVVRRARPQTRVG
ncbi:MAG: hypothetical protein JWN95_345 [Frankiales bacterium]|nr:hypothetical protein [Frankiales bacterium]